MPTVSVGMEGETLRVGVKRRVKVNSPCNPCESVSYKTKKEFSNNLRGH